MLYDNASEMSNNILFFLGDFNYAETENVLSGRL